VSTLKKEVLEVFIEKDIPVLILVDEKPESCKISIGFLPEGEKPRIFLRLKFDNGKEETVFASSKSAAQIENAVYHARRNTQPTTNGRPANLNF